MDLEGGSLERLHGDLHLAESTPQYPRLASVHCRRRRRSRQARGLEAEKEGQFFFFLLLVWFSISIPKAYGAFCQASPRGLVNLYACCCFWKVSKSGGSVRCAARKVLLDKDSFFLEVLDKDSDGWNACACLACGCIHVVV